MKRLGRVFLIGLCVVYFSGCTKQNDRDDVIVASSQLSGYFMPSDGLSNTVEDMNVRDLIHGGSLITMNDEGEMAIDKSVVKKHEREVDKDGNIIYTFTLQDMLWSDGTSITSDDYLFSLLLAASPAYVEAQAMDLSGEGLLGYWDYYEKGEVFTGIKRISEHSFSFTIDAAELPYYWELIFMGVTPYPMKALVSEGEKIISNEEGSSFQGDMHKAVEVFTTTYNEKQEPSCGPYTFESYENGQVSLIRNEKYMGDYDGNKPSIEKIIIKEMYEETSMDALLSGEIDILEPVMEANKINKGKAAVDEEKLQSVSFERNGYGVFALMNDAGATKEVAVRRAIAYLIDRETLVKDLIDGYGIVIDSDYATSQWMYQENKDNLDLPYEYAFSIKKANEQLDTSSYRYEQDGITLWDEEKVKEGYYRYNEAKEELAIHHLATADNQVSDALELELTKNAIQTGIHYQMSRTDDAGLSEAYYFSNVLPAEERAYNAFTLGTQFASAPDPFYASIACDYANTSANPMNVCDPKLDELMIAMRQKDPVDKDGYLGAWLAYEQYFNEIMPQIPLYTSQYYGFANKDLKGYKPNSYLGWAQQISRISWN